MPRFSAMRWAPVNWSGESHGQPSAIHEPGPWIMFEPSGTRLIASTPHAMPTSMPSGGDDPGDHVVRLLRGSALGVDGRRRRFVREPGEQPRLARDVAGLLTGLRDASADDLLDERRVDARTLHDLDLRRGQQLGRVQSGQPAVATSDRCADSSMMTKLEASMGRARERTKDMNFLLGGRTASNAANRSSLALLRNICLPREVMNSGSVEQRPAVADVRPDIYLARAGLTSCCA